jgi:hypothetical protein
MFTRLSVRICTLQMGENFSVRPDYCLDGENIVNISSYITVPIE